MFKDFGRGRAAAAAAAPGAPPRPRLQEGGLPLAGSSSSSSSNSLRHGSQQQQQQKYQPDPEAGSSSDLSSSGFIPNLNTITTSNNLQWMVQPTIMGASPVIPRYSRPYHCPHYSFGMRPHIIRTAGPTLVPRRRHSEHLTPEEEERRRLRRERNKLAAAKCRNRRKELTDTLQAETDQLEAEQSGLRKEIAELQKQKDRLELVLETHRLACKIPEEVLASGAKEEGHNKQAAPTKPPDTEQSPLRPRVSRRAVPVPANITLTPNSILEPEALHTPTLMATPSLTPFTPSLVFTYPAPGDPDGPSSFLHEPCSSAHRRSSSGDHSSDSLNSPTLLAL